ncbi:PQQ-dependent sugar dehydrogenase [Rhodohalobacter sp. SW132]|nr:PQQ-dependent sugar dehydrogenase [Rhodohalobacter sp. SW132]
MIKIMRKILRTFVGSVIIVLSAITLSEAQLVVEEVIEESVSSEKTDFRIVKVVEGLEHPWAVNWLSDGRMIITERPGRLLIVDGNSITPLTGLPEIDTDEDQKTAPEGGNQGGLLDVVPHPEHAENGWVYFTYSSPGDDDSNFGDEDYATGTALARAKINSDGTALEDLEELYTQVPRTEPGRHYGSRIVFPGDGTVIFSIGDRGIRYPSQDLTDPGGAMIRLNEDGGAADDNPFVEMEPGNLRPEIYSFGHRNNQGLAIDPDNGNIWTTEHGPYGGDLVHIVVEGRNYGWPQVTQGVEYDTKAMIGIGKSAPGVEEPKHIWEESMAPSGLAFYHQGEIEEWNGSLFAGSLLKEQLHRLEIDGEEVVHDEVLITEVIGRIRDVRMGPDGNLYLVTDESDGGVYRIEAQ